MTTSRDPGRAKPRPQARQAGARHGRWMVMGWMACTLLALPATAGAQAAAAAASAPPASAAPAPRPARPATQHQDALRLLSVWLEAQRAYDNVPAVSAAVVIDQQVVWRRGFGHLDAARSVPAAPDSIYSICSISKLFTSVALMQLWEQGRFSLDDDITRLVPEAAIQRSDPDSGPISLRLLLSHAAGLPREADASYWNGPDFSFPDRATLLARLRGQQTLERSGWHHQYSNLGMALLGEAVAAAAGRPYTEQVQQALLAPLQMHDTRPLLPSQGVGQRLATGFGARQRDGSRPALPPFDTRGLVAAAGYTSTVDDLARFSAWQMRLLKNGGQELLKVATLREMQRVQWTDPDGGNTWGLGFGVNREGPNTVVGHGGWCPGFRSQWSLMPQQQLAVASMVNVGGADGIVPYGRQIRQLMLKGLKLPVAPTGAGAPRLEDYAGRYGSQPWASERVIVPWGDRLATLNLPSTDPANELQLLKPEGPDRFRAYRKDDTPAEVVQFERDASGRVSGYRARSQWTPRLGPLPE